jgi:cytochrome c oxidase subunit 2
MLEEDIVDAAADYTASVNASFIEAIAPAAAGDAANGATVFTATGCIGCHSLDGTPGAGPSLQGIASRAADMVEGEDAVTYLTAAIINPGAYVVEGYNPIMPAYDTLSGGDLADLIAYMLTLE